jgi:hypothetical protein
MLAKILLIETNKKMLLYREELRLIFMSTGRESNHNWSSLKHRWGTIKKEVSLFFSTRALKGEIKVIKQVMIR